jgi:hypothetical protein
MEKTNQPFFPTAAKDIFSAVITHFLENEGAEKRNNQSVKEFFDNALIKEYWEMLEHESNKDMRAYKNYISKETSAQTQGVLSELQQVTKATFIGNFEKSGTLSLRNLVRNKGGKVVFIEYDIGFGSMLSPIYSLLFDLAIKEALGRKEGERGNVYFIPNFPNLSNM